MVLEMFNLVFILTQELILVLMILFSVAFFSLMERKILAYIHFRKGPNKVMINGFFQPIVDAMKLLSKDDFPVIWSNKMFFYFSPMFMFFLSLISWMIFPMLWGMLSLKFSFIIVMIILGLSVYGVMLSGWSSNSVYGMLGAMRSICQSISYEVLMSFTFLMIIFIISDYCIEGIYKWKIVKLFFFCPFLLFIMIISFLAEMNRTPFDLAEGESELVSGYSVEYGGVTYTIIFISENISIFFSSFLIVFFFFSSLINFFNFFMFSLMTLIFCMIRGIMPRIRYDKLMCMCWNFLLPSTLILFNFMIILSSYKI